MPDTTELATTQTQDTEAQALATRATSLEQQAVVLVIDSDERYQTATDMVGMVSRIKKGFEELRVFLVKPLNDQVKRINDRFKNEAAPLERADSTLRQKMLAYQHEQQLKRQAEEARLRALAEAERARLQAIADKERAKLEAKAEKKGIELPPAPPPVEAVPVYAPPVAKTVAAAAASATMKTVWRFEITDKAAVPESFKLVNETAIGAAVRAGVREIAGVRIYEAQELAVRSR